MSNLVQSDFVLAQARAAIGYQEGVNNDNKFAAIAKHPNHQPWCSTFVIACFIQGHAEKAVKNTSSCIEMHNWGVTQKAIVQLKDAKAGDLILMDFTGSKVPQHIGIASKDFDAVHKSIETIEGNTGNVSQANGDGVYRKVRPAQYIFAVVRPQWSTPQPQG